MKIETETIFFSTQYRGCLTLGFLIIQVCRICFFLDTTDLLFDGSFEFDLFEQNCATWICRSYELVIVGV
jgi:hypothetical protein